MSKSVLEKAIFFIVYFIVLFAWTSAWASKPVQAESNNPIIGTHLGYGDINHQVGIMNDILAANGAGLNFPVTIMVQIHTNADDMEKLANTVKKHGFAPIVRINGACDATKLESVNVANLVKTKFGQDVVITFGNEVNNEARECTNPGNYTRNYLAVAALGGNISPSALDWYNTDYPAENFLAKTGLGDAYKNAPIRTANAYGCIGETKESCNPGSTNTQQRGIKGVDDIDINTQTLYLTEFSLSPGGESAPDENLEKVVQFIKNRASETEAKYVTPLVRNVCAEFANDGEWLLYVHGKLFTSNGQRVNPEDCTSMERMAPIMPRDKEKYITYPLNLVDPAQASHPGYDNLGDDPNANPAAWRDYLTYSLVKDQGYQVYCTSPELEINTKFIGDIQEYIQYRITKGEPTAGGQNLLNSSFTFSDSAGYQKAYMTEAKVAMLRGSELETQTTKTSSFEGFFGSLSFEEPLAVENTGAINNLLTAEDQCKYKVRNLHRARELCEMLENPKKCALHQEIPETNYYIYSHDDEGNLLADFESLMAAIEADAQDTCSQLNNLDDKSYIDFDQDKLQDIKDGINHMSLNLDRVYRMAYLVIAVQEQPTVKPPATAPESWDEDKYDTFKFLYQHHGSGVKATEKNAPLWYPLVISFKIPEFTTNKIESMPWLDSADLSTNSLRTQAETDKLAELEAQRRSDLMDNILDRRKIEEDVTRLDRYLHVRIMCAGTPICDGAHGTFPFTRVLVDIINGSVSTNTHFDFDPADNMNEIYVDNNSSEGCFYYAESAKDIGSHAIIPEAPPDNPKDGMPEHNALSGEYRFQPEYKAGYGKEKGLEGAGYPRTHGRLHFQWNMKVWSPQQKQRVPVQAYIVAPIGANLKNIEKTLQVFFADQEFFQMMKNNRIADWENAPGVPENLPIIDARFGAEGKAIFEFDTKCVDIDENTQHCEARSIGVKLNQDHKGLYLPGARLGWMIRKIQESLHTAGSKAHEYVKSCERTEDMFLGRCEGGPSDSERGFNGVPYNGSNVSGGWDEATKTTKCQIAPDDSPCAVDKLQEKIEDWTKAHGSDIKLEDDIILKRAKKASVICFAESGGNPDSLNDGCVRNETVDYSVGLFQINLLAHECPEYFNYTWTPPHCSILIKQDSVDECADKLLDPDYNIDFALNLSGGGANWESWSTAKKEYCGGVLESIDNPKKK